MAICKSTPRRPMTIEVAAITAGPVKNLTAIENVATDFPQAMIFGCKAMNKPSQPIYYQRHCIFMYTYT